MYNRFCADPVDTAEPLLCDSGGLFRRRYLRSGRDRLSLPPDELITIEDALGFIRRPNLETSSYCAQ